MAVDDLAEKEAVLAAEPVAFFTIPHFNGYAAVLIQLKKVRKRAFREALLDGWLASPRGPWPTTSWAPDCASTSAGTVVLLASRTEPLDPSGESGRGHRADPSSPTTTSSKARSSGGYPRGGITCSPR